MDRKAIRLADDLTIREEYPCVSKVGVGASSGTIEKNIDRSHPSFLEYRTISGPSGLRRT
jgi:hypothetical protein